jgi:hypothetical protein
MVMADSAGRAPDEFHDVVEQVLHYAVVKRDPDAEPAASIQ